METRIRKIGNSSGILLSKGILEQCQIAEDDSVELSVVNSKIIIEKSQKHPREGWEEQLMRANACQDNERFVDDDLENDFDRDEWTWE